jgi:hypothetical protein
MAADVEKGVCPVNADKATLNVRINGQLQAIKGHVHERESKTDARAK